MSELRVFEQARVTLEAKRRQLAAVMASGDTNLAELAASFSAVQNAIEALDRAVADERHLVDPDIQKNLRHGR